MSSVQFPDLFEVALEEYARKTKKDIKTDPLFVRFQDCNSSDIVLKVLEEQALAFEQYRQGDGKVQLMRRLKPTVDILLRLSTNDHLKEGIDSVGERDQFTVSSPGAYRSPCRYFHQRRQYLPVLVTYSKYIPSFPTPVCDLDTQS